MSTGLAVPLPGARTAMSMGAFGSSAGRTGSIERREQRPAGPIRPVTRRDGERQAQAEGALVVSHHVLVLDRDGHALSGPDVGDGGLEQVPPPGFDAARAAPSFGGRAVGFPRPGLLLDAAFDDPLADAHQEAVDHRVVGQGKEVGSLDPPRGRVLEYLRHANARDDARDIDGDLGAQGRRGDTLVPVIGTAQVKAAGPLWESAAPGRPDLAEKPENGVGEEDGGEGGGEAGYHPALEPELVDRCHGIYLISVRDRERIEPGKVSSIGSQ